VEFNIFSLRKLTLENELVTCITFLLHKHQLFKNLGISIDCFTRFINKIQSGYKDIPYHNKTHAADLSQTAYFCCESADGKQILKLDDMDLASIIIGGAIHDHEHPGFNNVYLVETGDEIAIRYNDVSVLENHHVASSFKLMKSQEFNIFGNMERED
jgi:hypothetical protein